MNLVMMCGCSSLRQLVAALLERQPSYESAKVGKLPHDSTTKSLGLAVSDAELVVSRYVEVVKLSAAFQSDPYKRDPLPSVCNLLVIPVLSIAADHYTPLRYNC